MVELVARPVVERVRVAHERDHLAVGHGEASLSRPTGFRALSGFGAQNGQLGVVFNFGVKVLELPPKPAAHLRGKPETKYEVPQKRMANAVRSTTDLLPARRRS